MKEKKFKQEIECSGFYVFDDTIDIETETIGCIGRKISEDRILIYKHQQDNQAEQ